MQAGTGLQKAEEGGLKGGLPKEASGGAAGTDRPSHARDSALEGGGCSQQSEKVLKFLSKERLSSMLLARGGSGVVAKIMARRSPGMVRWRADHSMFSALNLDGVSAARATGQSSSLTGPALSARGPAGAAGVLGEQLSSLPTRPELTREEPASKRLPRASCTAAESPPNGRMTPPNEAAETSAGSDSDLAFLSTSSETEAAAQTTLQRRPARAEKGSFEEVRDYFVRFRSSNDLGPVPPELATLVVVEAEQRPAQRAAATLRSRQAPTDRTILSSARLPPQDDSLDACPTPFARMQSAEALSTPFMRMHSGDSLSTTFSRMVSADALSTPFTRVASESAALSMPFSRMRTISSDPVEELKRTAQSLLNKVCPENIATIAEKIATIKVSSPDELETIIELVFKKALAEPHYCETYADLIFCLKSAFPEFPAKDGGRPMTFKSSVLNICQNEFESLPATLEPTAEERASCDEEELESCMKQRKDRMLANMKLIGHLFLRQLLPAKVIASVIQELLLCDQEDYIPEEHTVECACELLMSTGHTLESLPAGRYAVQQACGRLTELKLRKAAQGRGVYSKRLQFVIQDMLDARADGWTKKSFKSSAKTKEEVRLAQQRELNAQTKGALSPSAEKVVAGQRPIYISPALGA